jgi:hypothetical protein
MRLSNLRSLATHGIGLCLAVFLGTGIGRAQDTNAELRARIQQNAKEL